MDEKPFREYWIGFWHTLGVIIAIAPALSFLTYFFYLAWFHSPGFWWGLLGTILTIGVTIVSIPVWIVLGVPGYAIFKIGEHLKYDTP